jgi:hypothetical protein
MDHDRREQEMYTPSAQMQQDEYYRRALEDIERAKLRRQRADQLAKDRLHAELIMIGAAVLIIILIAMMIIRAGKKKQQQAECREEPESVQNEVQNEGPQVLE